MNKPKADNLIACPNCGHEFALTDAISGQLREHLRAEMQGEMTRREETLRKNMEKEHLEQLAQAQQTLAQREATIKSFREREAAVEKQRTELFAERAQLEQTLEQRLVAERTLIRQKEERRAAEAADLKLRELQEDLDKRRAEIETFRAQELALRKRQRELEDAQADLQLQVTRQLDEEREKIRLEAARKAAEEHRLKDLEKERMISDLKSSLDEMKRRAEQGSVEAQGEVLEQDFEARLAAFFVHDLIRPVPKGIRGADIVQTVRTGAAAECGIILWETKNTKSWNGQWLAKLKEDMIQIRADLAILVSVVLPDDIAHFGQVNGIWVSDPASALPLALALREQLLALQRERISSQGKNEKMETLYQYLAGVEFKQKIEGIVEAFTAMQDQLNQERRAMEKHWKQREKSIERVIRNTVGLYGDMQGIIGGQIPTIRALELDPDARLSLPGDVESEDADDSPDVS